MLNHRQSNKGVFQEFYDGSRRNFSCFSNPNPNEYTYVSGYGFAPPPPHVSERCFIRSYSTALGVAVLLFLFLSATLYGVALNLLGAFIPSVRIFNFQVIAPPIVSEMASGISYTLSLAIPFLLYCRYIHIPLPLAFPFKKPNWQLALPAVPISLGVTVVGIFSSSIIGFFCSLLGFLPVSPDLSAPLGAGAKVLFFVNSAVLPAFLEEMVFRGAMMQSLRRFGDSFALLTSSIVFALAHGNLVQAPNAFLAGLVIGYFVLHTGSLWTGILIHFCNNAVAVLVSLATHGASATAQLGVSYSVYALYIVGGLICLMAVLKNHSDLFVFPAAKTASSEKRKYFLFFTSLGMLCAILLLLSLTSHYFVVL